MDEEEARRRFAASPIARLATVRPDGTPHIVPVTFAAEPEVVYTAIDEKPKRSRRLQRLENLRHQPRCSLLVDHYEADWTNLWWVRADGEATVVDDPERAHPGIARLARRYPVYENAPPEGPLIIIRVARWRGWAASP